MPRIALHKYNLLGADVLTAESYGPLVSKQVEKVTALLDELAMTAKKIRASTKLTPEGKKEELAAAGRKAVEDLKKLSESPPLRLAEHLRALDVPERLPWMKEIAARRQEDPTVLFLLHRDLREHLKAMDSIRRRAALMEAAENNDVDLLVAVRDTHPLLRPVRSDDLEEATAKWIEGRLGPKGQTIVEALNLYTSNVRTAERVIEKETGIRVARSDSDGGIQIVEGAGSVEDLTREPIKSPEPTNTPAKKGIEILSGAGSPEDGADGDATDE